MNPNMPLGRQNRRRLNMSRKRKIIGGILLLLFLCITGVFIYLKAVIPPGEEWLAYNSGKITADIDRQLEDLDIDTLISEKESLVLEKNIDELQQAVGQGKLTYEELAAICLYRIKTLDQSRHGYNSVTEVAADVLEQARACDTARSALLQSGIQFPPSPLFGIPVLLKDNINTADIPTSAGAEAFSTFLPREDAALVRTLREQGAVILGKNNLSEFANYLSSVMPSGYSGKAGQTVNPFGPLENLSLRIQQRQCRICYRQPCPCLLRDGNGRIHFRACRRQLRRRLQALPGQHIRRRNHAVDSGS